MLSGFLHFIRCWLWIYHTAFIMLRHAPSVSTFFGAFLAKCIELCQMYFLHDPFYLRSHVILSSSLCAILHLLICDIELFLHPWNENTLIRGSSLLNVLLSSVCLYYIENYCTYVHQRSWPISLLVLLCPYPVWVPKCYFI